MTDVRVNVKILDQDIDAGTVYSHRRRGAESTAMTKLEASDGEQRSYLEIAEVIERESVDATDELQQLWRRIVFSIMISNTDDIFGTTDSCTSTGTCGGWLRRST